MTKHHYKTSETLQKLVSLNLSLKEDYGNDLDNYLGISLIDLNEEEEYRYDCTPLGSIVFAATGMGGDHFAFFLSNHSTSRLDEAPIIFVQPMDSEKPVKLVARNIIEFLSLFLKLKELYVLEGFDWYETEDDFNIDYKDNYLEQISDKQEEMEVITEKLQQLFILKSIGNVYTYIKDLRRELPI
ncbi:hypothetical protein GC093_13970 [Paenibacillus sp. LMG 31456]|uniref:SMI1/KNR4 family protein n=1 Tax=Paenibacillus foliorum TaxID=2654974 RepID=A0A972GQ34_9BACL|nr:hypothetical protein [Paenibacillus foliorum]NOU94318.1 hypothetical protein [Paenibacillus foliorum]